MTDQNQNPQTPDMVNTGFDPKTNATIQNILKSKEGHEAPTEVPTAQVELEQMRLQIKDMEDRWKRSEADKMNLQRRAEQEKTAAKDYAVTSFARDLTAVLDNLYRAIESVGTDPSQLSGEIKHLYDGVVMTQKELVGVFDRNGIKRFVPLGEQFHHDYHQAMMQVDDASVEPGTITQVLQAGYMIKDRLLRPAMVCVAKAA